MYNPNSANSIRGARAETIVRNYLDTNNVEHKIPAPPADGYGDGGDIELNNGLILDVKTATRNTGNICCGIRKNINIDYYIGVTADNNILGAISAANIKQYRTLPNNSTVHLVPYRAFSLKLFLKLRDI